MNMNKSNSHDNIMIYHHSHSQFRLQRTAEQLVYIILKTEVNMKNWPCQDPGQGDITSHYSKQMDISLNNINDAKSFGKWKRMFMTLKRRRVGSAEWLTYIRIWHF